MSGSVIVTLDGSASSDPDAGDTLSYTWPQLGNNLPVIATDFTVVLSDVHAESPTFTSPRLAGTYDLLFSLTVTDSQGISSSADTVIITVRALHLSVSRLPLSITEGDSNTYTLSLAGEPSGDVTVKIASSNSDVSVVPVVIIFTQSNWNKLRTVTVSAAEDTDGVDDTAIISHSVMGADYEGVIASRVSVIVRDNDINAYAGPDQTVPNGILVRLDGTDSHSSDGVGLTPKWKQISGQSVILIDKSTLSPYFQAPRNLATDVTLTFQLTVFDDPQKPDGHISQTDTVTITIIASNLPIAFPGKDQTVDEGETVTLYGRDPDSLGLTYAWT